MVTEQLFTDIPTRGCSDDGGPSWWNILKTAGVYLETVAPTWKQVTKSHTDFQTAGLTNDIEIYSLSALEILHAVIMKHTTAFSGGSISSYTMSLGISGNLTKYSIAFDVFQSVANTTFSITQSFAMENFGSATSIRGAATSVGDNLDQSSAGAIEFYLLTSTLPS